MLTSLRFPKLDPQTPQLINTVPPEDLSPASSEGTIIIRDHSSSSSSPSGSEDITPDTSPTEDVDKVLDLRIQKRLESATRPRLEASASSTYSIPKLAQPVFSPLTFDAVDPFGQVPVRMTESMHQVLQTTLQIYPMTGNNYKLRHLPKHMRTSINQFPIQHVVRASVFKEHHLYALLAAISSRLHQFTGGPDPHAPRLFRAAAARHLREELLKSSKDGTMDKHTILDILFLCVSEMSHQEYDSARTHLNYITKLFWKLDMNDHFDFWISETAAHVDNQLSLSTGKQPVLPYDFDPGPMLPERMAMLKRELNNLLAQGASPRIWLPRPASLSISNPPPVLRDAISDLASTLDLRMGSKFELGLKIGIFNAEMSKIIRDLLDCVNIAKVVWLSPLAVCFDAEWLCRKARAVLRALLAIGPERRIGPLDMVGKCMESCRLALLIMMSHACTLIGFQTARTNVYRLQKAMAWALDIWAPFVGLTPECKSLDGRQPDSIAHVQLGFVLWSNMIGVWSSPEDDIESFFLVRATNLCRVLDVKTYEELNDHLSQYLYSKTLQEPSLRKVIARLDAG